MVQEHFPEAVPITLVLKEMLVQCRLNEPFSGGLSSYAVLLMVMIVIQVTCLYFPCVCLVGT